jgi:hypothetical protein
MANKIDSNVTGLRFAEEVSLKTLPGSPVWYPLEPNSYADFGGQISTVARNPINSSRQRKKGVTTDLEATGAFNQDLTFDNTTRLLQGFFFADIREKFTSAPMNGVALALTATTATTYTAASGLTGLLLGDIVYGQGFAVTANNGIKVLTAPSTATTITVTGNAVEASPPAAANLRRVGYQFASATLDVVKNGELVRLNRASGTVDFTTFGLIPGEWIYVGGDAAGLRFANNQGWARIAVVAATYIELDKTSWEPVNETGTGKTVQIFFGSVLKNESNPALIKRRTYQLERTLGDDGSGTMSEYLVGAVPNELTLNIAQADKVMMDLSFVAVDNEQRTGVQGVKTGTRPSLAMSSAFNTSSDVSRIKLALANPLDASPTPLFAFATEMTLTVNNNVSANKAIGVLGGFDTTAGTFEVGGSMNAYFADVTAVQAVRNNDDITLDILLLKKEKALLFDIPLLALGDGRLTVEQDQAITLPLETNAAESSFGHTLLFQSFYYLPDVA